MAATQPNDITALHPQPQFQRDQWRDLCGAWGFAYDDADLGRDEHWEHDAAPFTRTIQVPYPPEAALSGIADPGFHPIVWYRRTFAAPDLAPRQRLILHCGAIDFAAQVWVNGQLVARHEGGHTPFSADITNVLHQRGEQIVVVRAEDDPRDLAQPRGKQDWQEQPHSIWYQRTTGIWQPVWLEVVAATHLSGLTWTTTIDPLAVSFTGHITGSLAPGLRLRVQLALRGEFVVDDTLLVFGASVERTLTLDRRWSSMERDTEILWSPRHPNLLDATLTLVTEAGQIIDTVRSYVGVRTIGAADGRVILNGQPQFLRLVLEQGYWPESHLAAPDATAIEREVRLIKDLGFNGVRIHQKVEDPRFLYWCDRLGLLVWGEMAAAYVFTPAAITRLTCEWLEVITRDASHPCIMAWVPFNESWGVPDLPRNAAQQHAVTALYSLLKALDPTRLVIGNDGWEAVVGDILGVHDYDTDIAQVRAHYASRASIMQMLQEKQPGDHVLAVGELPLAQTPIIVSEFGGISDARVRNSAWHGYLTVGDEDAYLTQFRGLVEALLASEAIGGFCYTQLTDTAQERNGLLTEDRRPKFDFATIRSILMQPTRAKPSERIFPHLLEPSNYE